MRSPKTTSRRQLPANTKNKLIGAVEAGESVAQAARCYDIKEDAACSIMKKYKVTGSTKNLLRSGRPPKLTDADKHHIVRTARKQQRTPFSEIMNELRLDVCEQTIQNVLEHEGYHWHVAKKVPFLTRRHRYLRMSWAWLYKSLTSRQWRTIIWSDECYIYLSNDQGCIFVTHHADEVYLEECLVPTFKQLPVRVMVWVCIMDGRKGLLLVLEYPGGKGGGMNTKRYCEQVLGGVLEDFYVEMRKEHGQVHFQQDNTSCHVSKHHIC